MSKANTATLNCLVEQQSNFFYCELLTTSCTERIDQHQLKYPVIIKKVYKIKHGQHSWWGCGRGSQIFFFHIHIKKNSKLCFLKIITKHSLT